MIKSKELKTKISLTHSLILSHVIIPMCFSHCLIVHRVVTIVGHGIAVPHTEVEMNNIGAPVDNEARGLLAQMGLMGNPFKASPHQSVRPSTLWETKCIV